MITHPTSFLLNTLLLLSLTYSKLYQIERRAGSQVCFLLVNYSRCWIYRLMSTFSGHHNNSTSSSLHREEDPGTEKSCSFPRLKLALDLIRLWRVLCTLMLLSDVSGQGQRTDRGLVFSPRVKVFVGAHSSLVHDFTL